MMKIVTLIDDKISRLFEEINRHPLVIYWILKLKTESSNLTVYVNTKWLQEKLSLYGIEAILVSNFDDLKLQSTIVLDGEYPLLTLNNIHRIFKEGDNNGNIIIHEEQLKKHDKISYNEKLSIKNDLDFYFIKSFFESSFNHIRPVLLSSGYIIEKLGNSLKPKLLFSAPYKFFPEWLRSKIEKNFNVTFAFNAPYEVTKKLLNDVEVWITGTCPPYKIDKELITVSDKLKIIATPSTGTNHIDVNTVKAQNIRLISIKESPVIEKIYASSEFSFALMLAVVKKIPFSTNMAKVGNWREFEHEYRNVEVTGKTIGLVGLGRIGKKMATYANGMGLQVVGYDPYKKNEFDFVQQVSTLDELLQQSDIVSLHYHLIPETVKSFGKEQFDKMKPNSYFINTARGELVDEQALIEALETKKIKAAGVDVITEEHILEKYNHPLIKYARHNDNLIISPHIAGCTIDSESKSMEDILNQIFINLNGE